MPSTVKNKFLGEKFCKLCRFCVLPSMLATGLDPGLPVPCLQCCSLLVLITDVETKCCSRLQAVSFAQKSVGKNAKKLR